MASLRDGPVLEVGRVDVFRLDDAAVAQGANDIERTVGRAGIRDENLIGDRPHRLNAGRGCAGFRLYRGSVRSAWAWRSSFRSLVSFGGFKRLNLLNCVGLQLGPPLTAAPDRRSDRACSDDGPGGRCAGRRGGNRAGHASSMCAADSCGSSGRRSDRRARSSACPGRPQCAAGRCRW